MNLESGLLIDSYVVAIVYVQRYLYGGVKGGCCAGMIYPAQFTTSQGEVYLYNERG